MLTESFVAASLSLGTASAPTNSSLKDVGICVYEYQPQSTLRHGYKKSSSQPNCVAVGECHVFAAQADKAVINVYSREKGNQEATVPFPERVHSVAYVDHFGILVIGTEGGKIMLWEVGTGRLTISAASHLQAVSSLCVTNDGAVILSGSTDSSIHVWSLPNLISLSQLSSTSTKSHSSRSPLRSFSNHRKAISALACGNSRSSTNFAVSASTDQTCYLWKISDCKVLRTVLLPTVPLCFTMDPADRCVYIGYDNGHIQNLDLYKSPTSKHRIEPIQSDTDLAPTQMDMENTWSIPTPATGQANCLALTYDGTVLLSGHNNGKILSWDVAKGRFLKDVTDVGQPVTNMIMLRPEGFANEERSTFEIPNVVKPRLELNAVTDNGTCGIPASYMLQVKINKAARKTPESTEEDDFNKALTSPYFSKPMIDDAIQSLVSGSVDIISTTNINPALDINLAKVERLEDQVQDLNNTILGLHKYIDEMQQRKMARLRRRDELGAQKQIEYLEAVDKGEDGKAKIVEWMQVEREIDAETEDE